MKNRRLVRVVGIGAVALFALGAIVVAGGAGRESSDSVAPTSGEAGWNDGSTDDVAASIDKALGRPSAGDTFGAAPPVDAPYAVAPAFESGQKDAPSRGGGSTGSAGVTNSAAPPVPSSGGGTANLASTEDRKIVQTATMRLQVREVGASFEEVGRIATSAGGFIASSNFSLQGEQQVASLTIRVPTDRYQDTLRQVRDLGVKVDNEGSNASDVTEEYTDLSARLRNLEATETQLLGFLARAQNISEVLQVQDRLNTTRSEIERVKGRMALLDKLTELSTITVHLRPVVGAAGTSTTGGETFGSVVRDAWQDSLDFLGDIGATVVTALVFVWWVPFVGLPLLLIGQRLLRGRPHAALD